MIRLRYDNQAGECDLVLDDGRLEEGREIETAILVSIFTDRRVLEGEVPPGASRGGWWGERFPAEAGDVEGSRLWTLPVRGRTNALTAREAEGHAREALAWLVADGVCDSVAVTAAAAAPGVIALSIRATRAGDELAALALEVS